MPEGTQTDHNATQSVPRKRADWVRSVWGRATAPGAWRSWSAPATLGLAIAGQTVVLGWMASTLYFIWGDDYDFLLLRGAIDREDVGLLAPHDDHWSTGTILIYKLIFQFVGLRHYLPYGMVTILFHMALIVVMYLVMRRLGAGSWAAAVPGIVLAFGGAGSGAILWDTTMGTVAALLLGFVAVLNLVKRPDRTGVWGAWVVLVLALTMSGAGITAVFFTVVFTWLNSGLRRAALVGSVPTAVFLIWFIAYGRGGVKPALDDGWQYAEVPAMIWQGLVAHVERVLPFTGIGALLLVVLVGSVFVPVLPRRQRNLAAAGAAAALFQVTLAALTRPEFGPETFNLPRYGYYTIVFLAPALSLVLTQFRRWSPQPRWIAAGLAAWLLIGTLVHGEGMFRQEQADRRYVTDPGPGILRGIVAATKAGSTVLTPGGPNGVLDARFRADLIAEKGMWRHIPGGETTSQERLDAEGLHFVGVADEAWSVPLAGDIDLDMWWVEKDVKKGCSYYTATLAGALISIDTGVDGAQVGIQGPGDTVTTTLRRGDEASGGRTWPVTPGETVFVGTTAHDASLDIAVSVPGTYLVCP